MTHPATTTMLQRLLLVLVCAALGLGAVLALPDQIRLLDSAVRTHWPLQAGDWVKVRDGTPSPQEIAILAKDTRFFKAQYMRPGTNVPVDAGIVLSGDDINNSIHRPERCLVAQGHSNLTHTAIQVPMANGRSLPVMRLTTSIRRQLHRQSAEGPPGATIAYTGITYYWFVGHDIVTNGHYTRTFKDMSDRLLRGSNQRWAYITLSVYLPDTPANAQVVAKPDGPVDQLLQDFIAQVVPGMIDYTMVRE